MDEDLLIALLCTPAVILLLLWAWSSWSSPAWPRDGRKPLAGSKETPPVESIDFDGAKLIHQLHRSIALDRKTKADAARDAAVVGLQQKVAAYKQKKLERELQQKK